ncbi:uncharacterized protein PAE49_017947 [Odontesthes bonariensis]|uniref:uncharacterized protein LOC142402147 n=1 Tax=Odontesthes bonariensis TaxID=219752 RepID=UPI003F58E53D
MFFENAHLQQPRRHHDFFLRSRPYRGEPPTVAGFLLYPDTPARMETTSQEAFCFRPSPQGDRGKGARPTWSWQQEPLHPYPTSSRQTGKGNSSRDRQAEEDEQDTREIKSQYQKDFPPPSSRRPRRTPALPQPDNIGINPAFRFEFNTVQRDAYKGWPPVNTGRLRGAPSGWPNITSERKSARPAESF